MALEAYVASQGGFEALGKRDVEDFMVVRLKEDFKVQSAKKASKEKRSATQMAEKAWAQLEALATLFADPNHPYASYTRKKADNFIADYDHLSRVAEWGSGADVGGDE